MALSFLRNRISPAFCLQTAACTVVAWSVLHGGITVRPPPAQAPAQIPATAALPDASTAIAPGAAPAPAEGSAAITSATAATAAQLAAAPGLAEARLALSSIDVIVSRNDSLDRIFRRLQLNLADLASLR